MARHEAHQSRRAARAAAERRAHRRHRITITIGIGFGALPITAFYDANGRVVDKSFGALLGTNLDAAIHQVYGIS